MDEIEVVGKARPLSQEEAIVLKIREIERKVVTKAFETIDSAGDWVELDPDDPAQMPEGWISKYGEKEAKRRHRIAQAALLASKDAPIGLKMARDTITGYAKAEAIRKQSHVSLNIEKIQMVAPPISYKVLDVTE